MIRLAWVLAGLLALASGLLWLGRRETTAFPAADSYAPSGVSAFAELLRRQGRTVTVDRSPRPRLSPGQVAVAFVLREPEWSSVDPGRERFFEGLVESALKGTALLLLPIDREFAAASLGAEREGPAALHRVADGARLFLLGLSGGSNPLPDLGISGPYEALWRQEDEAEVVGRQVGSGVAVAASDGLFATNRFLDREGNAEMAVALVEALGPQRPIVFVEGGFGNVRAKGIAATLGPWAVVVWAQVVLLLVVAAIGLGTRFGLARDDVTAVAGQRLAVDALAEVYRRGRYHGLPVSAAAREARRRWAATRRDESAMPDSLARALERAESFPPQGSAEEARKITGELLSSLNDALRPQIPV